MIAAEVGSQFVIDTEVANQFVIDTEVAQVPRWQRHWGATDWAAFLRILVLGS